MGCLKCVLLTTLSGVTTLSSLFLPPFSIQGCHGQGKISGKRIFFFKVREKSGNFVDGQRNLERTWKVRGKSGNLKINGYGRQSSENLFILFKRGKHVLLMR